MISDVKDNVAPCFCTKQTDPRSQAHTSVSGIPRVFANRIANTQGFSLIEVMISVVLLTASILGLAALQTVSTRLDHQALLRTRSILQADDIVDRMRANPGGVKSRSYFVTEIPENFSKNCDSASIECTPSELAEFDLVEWNRKNRQQLPLGKGQILGYTSTSAMLVMLRWTEQEDRVSEDGNYSNPCDSGKNHALHCFTLEVRL